MTSTLQAPTHTYTVAGAYTVTLAVSRDLTETHTLARKNYILVGGPFQIYLPTTIRAQ